MTEHTDKNYEYNLRELKETILKMGGIVEEMLLLCMKSLIDRAPAAATEVFKKEPEVNRLEMEIDELCIKLLALHQPAASDLRFITIGLKINKDLERMGDLAVNISEITQELSKEAPLKPYVDLPKLAERAQKMVRMALDAFVKQDVDSAKTVCEMDDEADNLKDRIQKDLVNLMLKDSQSVSRAIPLITIAKHLERVADHATNIAEEVIYMVKGKDIRHGGQFH